jgi:DNA-binding NarL/FixJ family response regulator
MKGQIKVIVVDDHEIFRNGLKMILGKLKYVKLVGEAANGQEFLDLIEKKEADVVLMDIEMPVMNGIEATKIARNKYPNLKIIVLTMFNDEDYIKEMMDMGVKGYLIKNIKKDLLDKAITTVFEGGTYYSEELFNFFTRSVSKEDEKEENKLNFKLTDREKEILQLLAEGLNNKEIGEILFISERTVIGHKSNLLAKTGCKSTVSLLAFAIRHNLVVIS